MTKLPQRPQQWGPLDALYYQLRRSLPQIQVSREASPECLRVTYKDAGPADLVYDPDIDEYRWTVGAASDARVGGPDDLDEVLRAIAERLGAVLAQPSVALPLPEGDHQ